MSTMTENDQEKRFQQAADDLATDQSDDALDRIMGKLDLKKKSELTPPATGRQSSGKQP